MPIPCAASDPCVSPFLSISFRSIPKTPGRPIHILCHTSYKKEFLNTKSFRVVKSSSSKLSERSCGLLFPPERGGFDISIITNLYYRKYKLSHRFSEFFRSRAFDVVNVKTGC